MNRNTWIALVIVAVVGVGGGFYGGMKYQQSQRPSFGGGNLAGGAGTFASRTGGTGRTITGGAGGGATFGTIVAKDAGSITIQLASGTSSTATGSKIVLYDSSTQVNELETVPTSNLSVGQTVTVTGTANSDGSITAQSIQVRPASAGGRSGQ